MKRKKLLSMAVAGMLVAAQMVMPVAAEGGEMEVNVGTTSGIVRVEVPTTLVVAIDQFETDTTGTQIASGAFDIVNKSQVNVKVVVTSTVTAKTGVTFAAKKADVSTATAAGGTAWLAMAAKISANNYQNTTAGSADDFTALNEASKNVATFTKSSTATTAVQTFYLKKSTGTVANDVTYALMIPTVAGKANVSYAQFYELNKITTVTDLTTLNAALRLQDVYYYVKDGAASETEVKKIAKGTTVTSSDADNYENTNEYCSMAATRTLPGSAMTTSKVYAYPILEKNSDTNVTAAFRYIGKLSSSASKSTWDSTDISKIKIAYEISGLEASVYDAAVTASEVTYGLYRETPKAYYLESGGVAYLAASATTGFAAKPSKISVDGTDLADADWTFSTSNGWVTLKNKPDSGKDIIVTVNDVEYPVTTP